MEIRGKKMRKWSHEEHEKFRDFLCSILYFFILMSAVIFTVFVWLSCNHIEDILNFLVERTGL